MHYFLGAKKAHFTFGIHNSKETLTAKVINSVKILQFKIITSNPFVLCISCSGLSLRATDWGFPLATMSMSCTYLHEKQNQKKTKRTS